LLVPDVKLRAYGGLSSPLSSAWGASSLTPIRDGCLYGNDFDEDAVVSSSLPAGDIVLAPKPISVGGGIVVGCGRALPKGVCPGSSVRPLMHLSYILAQRHFRERSEGD
jgi:hypothetical protein